MIKKIYFNILTLADNFSFYLSLYNYLKNELKILDFEEFYKIYNEKEEELKINYEKIKNIEFNKNLVIKPIVNNLELFFKLINIYDEIIIIYYNDIPSYLKNINNVKYIENSEFNKLKEFNKCLLIDYTNNVNINTFILSNPYFSQDNSNSIFDLANKLNIKDFKSKNLNYVDLGLSDKIFEKIYYNQNYNIIKEIPYSKIVGGKKVGKKLGIPTANLNILDRSVLCNFLPGIYKGKCKFQNDIEELDCIVSFGFNPQYDEKYCKFEVLILKNFENVDFYDSYLKVDIKNLIRYEAKFNSFSQFIETMILDISNFYQGKLIN